jgi:hypothetical protein
MKMPMNEGLLLPLCRECIPTTTTVQLPRITHHPDYPRAMHAHFLRFHAHTRSQPSGRRREAEPVAQT